jgi:hypothetical protein
MISQNEQTRRTLRDRIALLACDLSEVGDVAAAEGVFASWGVVDAYLAPPANVVELDSYRRTTRRGR